MTKSKKPVLSVTQQDVDNIHRAERDSRAGVNIELYSIFDRKALSYAPPFTAPNDMVAARLVLAEAQRPESLFASFPEDYELYHVGFINQSTGYMQQDEVRFCSNVAALLQAAMNGAGSGAVKS